MKWPLEIMDVVPLIARILVAATMFLGGVGKALNLKDFRKILTNYEIVPAFIIPVVSIVFVAWEVTVAVGLLSTSAFVRWAGMSGAVLLVLYTTAIAINLIRGRELPCGCGGRRSEPISWFLVLRNAGLVGLSLIATGKFILAPSVLVVSYLVVATSRLMAKSRSQSIAKEVS